MISQHSAEVAEGMHLSQMTNMLQKMSSIRVRIYSKI